MTSMDLKEEAEGVRPCLECSYPGSIGKFSSSWIPLASLHVLTLRSSDADGGSKSS